MLEWARERFQNTHRLAATKRGADRDSWLEDGRYWHAIVTALEEWEAVQGADAERTDIPVCPTCHDSGFVAYSTHAGGAEGEGCPTCAPADAAGKEQHEV